MKLHTCTQCGGPRRSLRETICAKCRGRHPMDTCPGCGKRKKAASALCRSCHIPHALAARWRDGRDHLAGSSLCPSCGAPKGPRARICQNCRAFLLMPRCPRCGNRRFPGAIMCHMCRYGWKRRHGWTIQGPYMLIYAPTHPNSNARGWVRRTHMVMTAVRGQPIARDEVVHHINGNKLDDRPHNLAVLTRREHTALHHAQGDILH